MRHLSPIVSFGIGLALVPVFYLGLAYSRGQTLAWMPRWMVPAVTVAVIPPPSLTPEVEVIQVATLSPSRIVQSKAGKLK